jgi:hypothetical protein
MAGTSLAEASDIEKTASEIYALWNSTKEIERKLDKPEVKTLLEEYGIVPEEFKKSSHIIFKILKSRSLPAGYYKKLGWNGNTGAISNEAESFNKPAGPKFED